jgi:uncharacterized membrane protein YedE/YeeE
MKTKLSALLVGFLFALGLGISGMTQPQKVVGFLDIFGSWDPSLIFVMLGAIAVHFITFKIVRRRTSPLFSPQWHVPTKTEITPALIIGGFIFGAGWGLGGLCPGPALTALASLELRPFLFVGSMLVGMLVFNQLDKQVKFRK